MKNRRKSESPVKPVFEAPKIVATYDKKQLEEIIRPHLPALPPYA